MIAILKDIPIGTTLRSKMKNNWVQFNLISATLKRPKISIAKACNLLFYKMTDHSGNRVYVAKLILFKDIVVIDRKQKYTSCNSNTDFAFQT
jgi:hypothetical protein